MASGCKQTHGAVLKGAVSPSGAGGARPGGPHQGSWGPAKAPGVPPETRGPTGQCCGWSTGGNGAPPGDRRGGPGGPQGMEGLRAPQGQSRAVPRVQPGPGGGSFPLRCRRPRGPNQSLSPTRGSPSPSCSRTSSHRSSPTGPGLSWQLLLFARRSGCAQPSARAPRRPLGCSHCAGAASGAPLYGAGKAPSRLHRGQSQPHRPRKQPRAVTTQK